jgi:hypothetical protein
MFERIERAEFGERCRTIEVFCEERHMHIDVARAPAARAGLDREIQHLQPEMGCDAAHERRAVERQGFESDCVERTLRRALVAARQASRCLFDEINCVRVVCVRPMQSRDPEQDRLAGLRDDLAFTARRQRNARSDPDFAMRSNEGAWTRGCALAQAMGEAVHGSILTKGTKENRRSTRHAAVQDLSVWGETRSRDA